MKLGCEYYQRRIVGLVYKLLSLSKRGLCVLCLVAHENLRHAVRGVYVTFSSVLSILDLSDGNELTSDG